MKKEKKINKEIKEIEEIAKKPHKLWNEFKAFIARGNAFDMAVGVVIGGAFNAIVTTLVSILLSLSTWGVPGGLKGLVTVLPALNAGQTATTLGWQDAYSAAAFMTKAGDIGTQQSSQAASLFISSYTQRGNMYYYNGCALIDWGSFINAIITFIIIALTLFIIIKVFTYLSKKRAALELKVREEYYKVHPEERPKPKDPTKPLPTEVELLTEIRDSLKGKQEEKAIKEK